ncbi:hypothetical protein ACLK1W_04895 [Escherichia coli]
MLAVATLNGERLDGEMSEGELMDAFSEVSEAFEQTGETIGVRANNAINDMVRQRLFNRFTSEQVEGNAIYRLTPFGIGISDYYIRQREFLSCDFLCSCRSWRVRLDSLQVPPRRAVMNFTGIEMSLRH